MSNKGLTGKIQKIRRKNAMSDLKNTKGKILNILEIRKGVVVSGEQLAKELNVTRSAIWKAISQLKKEGYKIASGTNNGYSLLYENVLLSAGSINKYLDEMTASEFRIDVKKTVESTNTFLKDLAAKGEMEGRVIIAEEQNGGKGRLNRIFHSPKETGLYMSVLLRPQITAQEAQFITAAAAVVVAEAIEKVADKKAQIKWVNDIFCQERKVCGILTEAGMNFENQIVDYVVIGIGINVVIPQGGFPKELNNIAGAIFENEDVLAEGVDLTEIKSRLAAEILKNIKVCTSYKKHFELIEEYKRRSLLIGREVIIKSLSGETDEKSVVLGINDEGALIVRTENGIVKTLIAGEVTLGSNVGK